MQSNAPRENARVTDLGSLAARHRACDYGTEGIRVEPPTVPGAIRFPGVAMGAANEIVLQDLLGCTQAEVAALKPSGPI